MKELLDFRGFDEVWNATGLTKFPQNIDRIKNLQTIGYGLFGSGKPTYIKNYINHVGRKNCINCCRDTAEWDSAFSTNQWGPLMKYIKDTETINKTTQFYDKTIILDDIGAIGNEFKHLVENIATVGRHFKIQLIYIAHHATDVTPKFRINFHKLYVIVDKVFSRMLRNTSKSDASLRSFVGQVWV